MSLTEKKSLDERLLSIQNGLSKRFERVTINDRLIFQTKFGTYFVPFAWNSRKAIGIEYAENREAAEANSFEDGDLFSLDDMDQESMLKAILEEIERNEIG